MQESHRKGVAIHPDPDSCMNVIDKRTEGESNKTFKVGFGFEYQRGWTDSIPAGFSFLISGDADLLKILQGGQNEMPQ